MKKLISDFSPNNKRLHYPVYGEFGYAQPVGRKKYEPRLSPIHKLIFNTDLPPITREEYQKIKMQVKDRSSDPDNPTSKNYHRYLRARSIAGNNFSSIYSPEDYRELQNSSVMAEQMDISQRYQSKQSPLLKQYSEREKLNKSSASNQNSLNSERSLQLKTDKYQEDSLDNLIKPQERYDVKLDRKKERVLDQMIRHRSRNPTYLNSQL